MPDPYVHRSLFSQLVEWDRRVQADPTLARGWPAEDESSVEDAPADAQARAEAQNLDNAMYARKRCLEID